MTCGASVGCSMRSANFSSVFRVASWSGISCSCPRPRPIMALGTWPVMHITGALTPHAVVSAPMVFITPGPGHHGEGRGLAGGLRVAQRHVGRGLLVPRVDHLQPVGVAREGVEQAVHLHAGQAEDGVDAVPQQGIDDGVAAGHAWHGVLLSCLAADEVADLDAAVAPFGEYRGEQREDVQLVGPDREPRIDARGMHLLGDADGVIEQRLGRADLHQGRRQALQVGMQRRGERRLGILAVEIHLGHPQAGRPSEPSDPAPTAS